MLNEKHNKIQVALLSTHDHRSHQKLGTKSPNKILTQHACKESLIYTVNNGKQPKKNNFVQLLHVFPFIFHVYKAKPKEEGKGVLSLFCLTALAIYVIHNSISVSRATTKNMHCVVVN